MMRTYKRDKRSPKPLNAAVSHVMSGNRSKRTSPEVLLFNSLTQEGLQGMTEHVKIHGINLDIALITIKMAIFVHGCYWHRCPHCQMGLPVNNREFWASKFNANQRRDLRNARRLRARGWSVYTVWECRLKNSPQREVRRVLKAIASLNSVQEDLL